MLAALTAPGLGAQAEAKKQPPPPPAPVKKDVVVAQAKPVMVAPGDLKWGPPPPGLPAGAEIAAIDGDPNKPGLFTVRIKAPDGYMVQPHWHPTDEHITILSGAMLMGTGAKWDDSAMHEMAAGTYGRMPKRVNHFVKTKGETTFQLTAMGPFAITYVNANDDPRKKKTE